MKKLTASEARDLTELAGMSEIYEVISRRAMNAFYTVEFTTITEKEFNQLTKDGFAIFIDYGTEQLTKYDNEAIEKSDYLIISWRQ